MQPFAANNTPMLASDRGVLPDSDRQPDIRAIALYLPQFHPIPENDQWWGAGFTEWTNTAKARPLFKGHYQPHIPGELGYYDLRLAETREAQARLASEYGIEAFCYYHYWFGGKQLLERPFAEVLRDGQPSLAFCLCWANETWTGIWHGAPGRILIEQIYPGEDDHRRHFEALLPAFLDQRYLRVNGKPLFKIYQPTLLPDPLRTTELWRELASRAGLPGLYLVCVTREPTVDPKVLGFDAAMWTQLRPRYHPRPPPLSFKVKHEIARTLHRAGRPMILPYAEVADTLISPPVPGIVNHPCVIPNWDNSPRSGRRGTIFHGSTPDLFRAHVKRAAELIRSQPDQDLLLFIKSWNEWAEGNHLEPDRRWGRAYLEAFRDGISAPGTSRAPRPYARAATT